LDGKAKSRVDEALQQRDSIGNKGLAILWGWRMKKKKGDWVSPRGDGKITTGITGLLPPSVHSDVAF